MGRQNIFNWREETDFYGSQIWKLIPYIFWQMSLAEGGIETHVRYNDKHVENQIKLVRQG
jgi:hypothetical protein